MQINFVFWPQSFFPKDFPEQTVGGTESAVWGLAKQLCKRYDCRFFFLGKENIPKELSGMEMVSIKPPFPFGNKWIAQDYFFLKAMREIRKCKEKSITNAI